jgi:predicted RNase H-like HicB family nuclease
MKTHPPFPYQITVRWSTVEEAYLAQVSELKDCLAFGDTPAQAVEELLMAAAPWLESPELRTAEPSADSCGEGTIRAPQVFSSATLTNEMLMGDTTRCFMDATLPEPETEQNFSFYVAWLAEHLFHADLPVPPRHAWVLEKMDKAVSPEAAIGSLGMGAGYFDEGSYSLCSAIQRGLGYRDYMAEKLEDWQEWDDADPATLYSYTVNPDLYERLEAEEAERLKLGVTSDNADIPYRPFLAHALKKLPDHADRVSAIRGFFAEYHDAARK